MNYNFNDLDIIMQQRVAMEIKKQIESKLQTHWDKFVVQLLVSLGISGFGTLISYISHEGAKTAVSTGYSYEAHYVIFVGLIIGGIVGVIKTLCLIPEIKKDIEFNRKLMWNSFGIYDYEKYYK